MNDLTLQSKGLNIICGQPGSGKSVMACQLAEKYVNTGLNVCAFFLDESYLRIKERWQSFCINTDISHPHLFVYDSTNKKLEFIISKVKEAAAKTKKEIIIIIDSLKYIETEVNPFAFLAKLSEENNIKIILFENIQYDLTSINDFIVHNKKYEVKEFIKSLNIIINNEISNIYIN